MSPEVAFDLDVESAPLFVFSLNSSTISNYVLWLSSPVLLDFVGYPGQVS